MKKRSKGDARGDKCKDFERREGDRRAMLGIPLIARLDGRAFHSFTGGLARPYDERMSRCMIETTKVLVDDSHALIGYTQSDEITLAWFHQDGSQYPFNGRFQKVASVMAGLASARFAQLVRELIPEKHKAIPHFDCRVWQVPSMNDVLDILVWREDDATKNSITMAASAYYSNSQLLGKNGAEKQDMLHAKGINWNDYPAFFKRGTYVARRNYQREIPEEQRLKMPEATRPAAGAMVMRTAVVELDLQPIRRLDDRMNTLFPTLAAISKDSAS